MNNILKVNNIMTEKVVVLHPGDSLEHAVTFFDKYDFEGFPVINDDKVLVGILTAYDVVSKSSNYYMRNLVDLINRLSSDTAGEKEVAEYYQRVRETKVEQVMNVDPLVVSPQAPIEDLAKEFALHHRVNPIPVIDDEKKLVGVVSRYDIIKFFNETYLGKLLARSGHSDILKRLNRLTETINP